MAIAATSANARQVPSNATSRSAEQRQAQQDIPGASRWPAQDVSLKQNQQTQGIQQEQPTGTIHARVNEVTTPVTVEDKKGNFLLGLTEKDFHVFDNGVEQHINRWGLDDRPLALALVVETSSHIDMMAQKIRSNGIVVSETLMAADGEAAVIGAGDAVNLLQPFTRDHDAVEKAINGLRFRDANMRLYDAMFAGALLLAQQPDTSHRVLLVIAEAQDGGSKHKLEDVLEVAQRANISIYTIGLSSTAADLRDDPVKDAADEEGTPQPAEMEAPTTAGADNAMCLMCVAVFLVQRVWHVKKSHAMAAAVAFTGGAYYHPFKDRNIQINLSQIAGELHSHYVLSYQLQGPAQPGIHQIEVRVEQPHVKVRARLGYYLAPQT